MVVLPTAKFISPKTDSKELDHKLKKRFLYKILRDSQEEKPMSNTASNVLPWFLCDKIVLVPVMQQIY